MDGFRWSVTVEPLLDRVVRRVAPTLWILLGTVALVLLVAGANVANLFLVRAESRQREIAVRAALGASRGRIAGTFLAESVVLALTGGSIGLLLAAAGTRLLVAYGPAQLPRLDEVRMDARVFLFAAALSALTALALGMLPAMRLARRSFATAIREPGRGVTAGRDRHRVRQLLIVAQVAMALVLLVAAGLMVRSAARLNAIDPGFRPDGFYRWCEPRRRARSRAGGDVLPPGAGRNGACARRHRCRWRGQPSDCGDGPQRRELQHPVAPAAGEQGASVTFYTAVTAGYFETLGVPLLRARAGTRRHRQARPSPGSTRRSHASSSATTPSVSRSTSRTDGSKSSASSAT